MLKKSLLPQKQTLVVLWPLVALVACAGQARDQDTTEIAFTPLTQGKTTALRATTDFVVARTQRQWEGAWQLPVTDQHGLQQGRLSTPPAVRFSDAMVLGVVLPAAPNSCTSVEVVAVSQTSTRIVVKYRGHRPQQDDVCLQAFFAPYAFVTVPPNTLEVAFVEVPAQ